MVTLGRPARAPLPGVTCMTATLIPPPPSSLLGLHRFRSGTWRHSLENRLQCGDIVRSTRSRNYRKYIKRVLQTWSMFLSKKNTLEVSDSGSGVRGVRGDMGGRGDLQGE